VLSYSTSESLETKRIGPHQTHQGAVFKEVSIGRAINSDDRFANQPPSLASGSEPYLLARGSWMV
jgi:hypothetical protein